MQPSPPSLPSASSSESVSTSPQATSARRLPIQLPENQLTPGTQLPEITIEPKRGFFDWLFGRIVKVPITIGTQNGQPIIKEILVRRSSVERFYGKSLKQSELQNMVSAQAIIALSRQALESGRYTAALSYLERALSLPQNPALDTRLQSLLTDFVSILEFMTTPNDAMIPQYLSTCLEMQSRIRIRSEKTNDNDIHQLKKAITLNPNNEDAYRSLIELVQDETLELDSQQDTWKVIRELCETIQTDPRVTEAGKRGQSACLTQLAQFYLDNGGADANTICQILERALTLDPHNETAFRIITELAHNESKLCPRIQQVCIATIRQRPELGNNAVICSLLLDVLSLNSTDKTQILVQELATQVPTNYYIHIILCAIKFSRRTLSDEDKSKLLEMKNNPENRLEPLHHAHEMLQIARDTVLNARGP